MLLRLPRVFSLKVLYSCLDPLLMLIFFVDTRKARKQRKKAIIIHELSYLS